MGKREPNQSPADALDAWVLGMVAQKARESVPGGNVALAFSAFLSEVAGDPYLYKMRWSRAVHAPASNDKGRAL